jgi:hypothetical protein
MDAYEFGVSPTSACATSVNVGRESIPFQQEVRCSVRFPLSLPVVLSLGQKEYAAVTRDISSSGALFGIDCALPLGMEIQFSLRMPSDVLGTPRDVLVQCVGRVVRCCLSQSQYLAATTIDEYQFAEQ